MFSQNYAQIGKMLSRERHTCRVNIDCVNRNVCVSLRLWRKSKGKTKKYEAHTGEWVAFGDSFGIRPAIVESVDAIKRFRRSSTEFGMIWKRAEYRSCRTSISNGSTECHSIPIYSTLIRIPSRHFQLLAKHNNNTNENKKNRPRKYDRVLWFFSAIA